MTGRRKMTAFGVVLGVVLIGSQGLGERVALAGDLEPPGPPSPTMKTLEQTTGSWDQVLPAAERFVLVMGGAAVLDKETNLVWEQSPLTTTHTWLAAHSMCLSRNLGGRLGWRVPWINELVSLLDPGNPTGDPDLPPGNLFSNVQLSSYWSATTRINVSIQARVVNFGVGGVFISDKTSANPVWCVRGGSPLLEH